MSVVDVLHDLGPIWRSTRRQRPFALLVLEIAVTFIVLTNLIILGRWFTGRASFPTGHREADLVEVLVRRPATPAASHEAEVTVLRALPGVKGVAPVSAVQSDDEWAAPDIFWSDPEPGAGDAALRGARAVGPSACPGVGRTSKGRVVGWAVEAGPELPELIGLQFVEGKAAAWASSREAAQAGAIVSRCLARALFGAAPALGRALGSNRFPAARIAGVVEDVRMHVPFLYQTQVTAFYPGQADNGRRVRYLVGTAPGAADAVRSAAAAALGRLVGPSGLVAARVFAAGGARVVKDADGTVKIFAVVGGCIALGALLGNVTVAAFAVVARRRVIGIRRALGATREDIFQQLSIEAMIPVLMGCALGLMTMILLVLQARALFPGLRLQVIDVAAASLAVALTTVPARIFPALHASRVSPAEAGRTL